MRTVICGLGVLALVIAGLSVAWLYGDTTTPSVQAAGISLGVDVTTDGNTASALGTIDNCKRVEVGNDFDVDVYITDVTGLQAWDAFFAFDGSLLTLTGQQQMMIVGFSASDPVPDSGPHNHFLGYGARSKVDGSGVLVRLTFHANKPGVSTASISYNPLGPHLNPGSDPIAFDGPIFPASIAIGQDCPSTPVVTDSPRPTATLSPSPSPSPAPTATPVAGTPTDTPVAQTPTPTVIGQTSTPTPTATPIGPTPTPTVTPTLTVTPTPAPTSSQIILGDADCNGLIGLPDVLAALAYASNIPGDACQGRTDTDCDGLITANDVLRVLRFLADDKMAQPSGCAEIGSQLLG
jgi:Predicted solute binding protein